MKTLITFANMDKSDGAHARFITLRKRWNPDAVIALSFEGRHVTVQSAVDKEKTLSYSRELSKQAILRNFFFEKSLLSARLPRLSDEQLEILSSSDEIYVHTLRIMRKIPTEFHNKVTKIDLCDDLVFTLSRSAFHYLGKLNILFALIYFWEALIEAWSIKKFSYASFSFISEPLRKKKFRFEVFPNLLPDIRLGRFRKLENRVRFGVIGNFRTVANLEILHNARKKLGIELKNITAFGLNSEELRNKFSELNIFGTFGDLNEIEDKFDVGLCLVNTQGGFQNKVLDYLLLGKIAVVNAEVYDALKSDSFYCRLLKSPFLLHCKDFAEEKLLELHSKHNFEINKKVMMEFS